jgi:P27 family predicted phage terminase small subunit
MRGPKPQPTWRRVLSGNPGKRALNKSEPQPETTDDAFLRPPTELADQPLALAEWRRLAPILAKARQITDADRSALLALCLEWARYLEATAKVKVAGLIVLSPNGYPLPNPYLAIATKALSGCTKLWPELGLTPSSRSRVRAPEAPPDDPFAEFDRPSSSSLPPRTN